MYVGGEKENQGKEITGYGMKRFTKHGWKSGDWRCMDMVDMVNLWCRT